MKKKTVKHDITVKRIDVDGVTKYQANCSCRRYRSGLQSKEWLAARAGDRHREDKS